MSIESIYTVCALVGGTILTIQFLLNLFGFGMDSAGDVGDVGDLHVDASAGSADVGADLPAGEMVPTDLGDGGLPTEAHSASATADHTNSASSGQHAGNHTSGLNIFRFFTIQTGVAFLTFFGLAGLAALHNRMSSVESLGWAFFTGAFSMLTIGFLFSKIRQFEGDGTIRLRNAVGREGQVYLRIPGQNSGSGKVSVVIQDRLVEVAARTFGDTIPPGKRVRIRGMIDAQTVEVQPL